MVLEILCGQLKREITKMKKILTFVLLTIFILPLSAKASLFGIEFTGLPENHLYENYLADPLAVNSEITYRNYEIDEVHPNANGEEGHFDCKVGTRFNFWRFSPKGHPDLGIETDWGFAVCAFMHSHGTDLLSTDGIYYYTIVLKPNYWSTFKWGHHHICSHQGDQLDTNGDGNQYIDYDNNAILNESNFVRDDYILSASILPLYFLNDYTENLAESLRVYGDFIYYNPAESLLGGDSNSVVEHAYIWFQYGAELELPIIINDNNWGSLYLAGQISQWQQSAYAKNYTYQVGIILPSTKHTQRMKFGYQFYDGQSLINNYQLTRARFSGFVFTIDQ